MNDLANVDPSRACMHATDDRRIHFPNPRGFERDHRVESLQAVCLPRRARFDGKGPCGETTRRLDGGGTGGGDREEGIGGGKVCEQNLG